MTDIPPPESNSDELPAGLRDRRHRLTSDELIALFVAFTSIGALLFWLLGWKKPFFDPGELSLNQAEPPATQAASVNAPETNVPGSNVGATADGTASPGSVAANGNFAAAGAAGAVAGAASQGQAGSSSAPNPYERWSLNQKTAAAPASTASPSPSVGNQIIPPVVPSPSEAAAPAVPSPTIPASPTTQTPASTVESPGKPRNFSDVPDSFWAHKYIRELSSRGVLEGFKDNSFKPDQPITRAEFAGLVGRAFEKPRSQPAIAFKDVDNAEPTVKTAITEATQTGFMSGYPNQVFNPNQPIPRHQMQ
ncbi:MAG: S-layer homology domain-containing protein, partial [Synechococcales bacterium]|nr:S-layer homology domain-containing protein [Synechococcales bacterium]